MPDDFLRPEPTPDKAPRTSLFGIYLGDFADAKRHVKLWLGLGDPFGVDHFETLYKKPDPWNYERSSYDLVKRQVVEFALGAEQYQRAFDVGSGEAHLAAHLRSHFTSIDLLDAAESALERARARVGLPGQNLAGDLRKSLAALAPGAYDLCLFSEVLYYFAPIPWGPLDRELRHAVARALRPGGRLVLVHPLAFFYHRGWRADPRFTFVRAVTLGAGRKVEVLVLERNAQPA